MTHVHAKRNCEKWCPIPVFGGGAAMIIWKVAPSDLVFHELLLSEGSRIAHSTARSHGEIFTTIDVSMKKFLDGIRITATELSIAIARN